jgi:hypothetical protein
VIEATYVYFVFASSRIGQGGDFNYENVPSHEEKSFTFCADFVGRIRPNLIPVNQGIAV